MHGNSRYSGDVEFVLPLPQQDISRPQFSCSGENNHAWGEHGGPGSSGVALAKVLNGFRCLRTPLQFLPGPGDLPWDCFLLICLSWRWGKRPFDALEASRRDPHTTPHSAPTSQACCLPVPAAAATIPLVLQGASFTLPSVITMERTEVDGQARHPGNRSIGETCLSSALFTSLYPEAGPELKLMKVCRYLIRPPPLPLPAPSSEGL